VSFPPTFTSLLLVPFPYLPLISVGSVTPPSPRTLPLLHLASSHLDHDGWLIRQRISSSLTTWKILSHLIRSGPTNHLTAHATYLSPLSSSPPPDGVSISPFPLDSSSPPNLSTPPYPPLIFPLLTIASPYSPSYPLYPPSYNPIPPLVPPCTYTSLPLQVYPSSPLDKSSHTLVPSSLFLLVLFHSQLQAVSMMGGFVSFLT
jgi:hypothetical protein